MNNDSLQRLEVQVGKLETLVGQLEKGLDSHADHGTRLTALETWRGELKGQTARAGQVWGILMGILSNLGLELAKKWLGHHS